MRNLKIVCLGVYVFTVITARADQSYTLDLGRRGEIELYMNERGVVMATARPNPRDWLNRVIRPLRDAVEIYLARNINEPTASNAKILGFLEVTDLVKIKGAVFAVVREKQASPSAPSYLAKIDVKMMDRVGLSLSAITLGALIPMGYAILEKFNSLEPLPIALSITATLAVAHMMAKEFLAELRRPDGWARLMHANSDFVRVESLVREDDRLVDLMINPLSADSRTEPKSLAALYTDECARALTF